MAAKHQRRIYIIFMDWYWNKDNFESLRQLAEALDKTPDLALVASYCRLRDQGLRKKALISIRQFVDQAAALSPPKRLEMAAALFDMHLQTPAAHQFLCAPLADDFIRPVFRAEAQPGNEAFWRLALMDYDAPVLRQALMCDPANLAVRKCLLNILLGAADFAMHHLDESHFIGDEAACRQDLLEAGNILKTAPEDDRPRLTIQAEELKTLGSMLSDWQSYQAQKASLPFPQYCLALGRPYAWPAKFYYNPDL